MVEDMEGGAQSWRARHGVQCTAALVCVWIVSFLLVLTAWQNQTAVILTFWGGFLFVYGFSFWLTEDMRI